MEYREYDSLPLKTFAKILTDESKLDLLGVPKDEQQKVWESIKEEYNAKHPSRDEKDMVSAHKKAQLSSIRLSKLFILLNFCFEESEEIKNLFDESGFAWHDEVGKRLEYLNKQIDKETQKLTIFRAQLEKMEETISSRTEKQKSEISLQEINDGLASMEINNIQIGDYDIITCGRYDSLTRMINKKAQNNG